MVNKSRISQMRHSPCQFPIWQRLQSSWIASVFKAFNFKNNVDISICKQLIAFLKRPSEGYTSHKSKIFTKDEIGRFLKEVDDKQFLLTKVSLINWHRWSLQ
ncbi:hypothetical protein Zmor_020554 [Zophobas morio]|uniref:Uncharacterized protein n=1 Tax=Zophobas morio TaxID=2755281 RepID=A0AA38I1K5_9CUCU|nr:hypothetical protein Zmor_020554 [Zophobas morio]